MLTTLSQFQRITSILLKINEAVLWLALSYLVLLCHIVICFVCNINSKEHNGGNDDEKDNQWFWLHCCFGFIQSFSNLLDIQLFIWHFFIICLDNKVKWMDKVHKKLDWGTVSNKINKTAVDQILIWTILKKRKRKINMSQISLKMRNKYRNSRDLLVKIDP